MRKCKILAIAPYEGMAEILTTLSEPRDDIDITIRVGDLHAGLKIARELSYNNYDVILSRGGTAELIQEELEIPVVDVPLSAYDMLRAIKMAENYSGTFAIAGFKSITDCAHLLCDLLHMDIPIHTFESKEYVISILQSLKDSSCQLVVSDMIGTITAKELGLNSILIPSGNESISAALDKAVHLTQTSHHVIKQKDIFQRALTCTDNFTVIYDSRSNLWFNNMTDSDLEKPVFNLIQTYLQAFVKVDRQVIEKQLGDDILTIRSQHVLYEGEQFIIIKIKRKDVLFVEDDIISVYNKNQEPGSEASFSYNSANYIGNTQNLIEEYSKTAFPVLITGESGTGKDKAATIIYENGPYQSAPYYVIDCSSINERKWHTLIESEKSPFSAVNTTIYIKSVESLSSKQFSDLTNFLEHSNLTKRNRLIFSLVTGGGDESYIYTYLSNKTGCLLLPLPALRDRIDDISSITTIYINQLNTLTGKQIVGFEPDAMELIKAFSWPHNLGQLRKVIKELVLITKSSYITKDSIRTILKNEDHLTLPSSLQQKGELLDLTQSLNDITQDIISIVLKEEGMNKERTANRLGISRSTLWRYLKSMDNE